MRLSRYESGKMGVCEVEADLGRDKEAGAHNLLKCVWYVPEHSGTAGVEDKLLEKI